MNKLLLFILGATALNMSAQTTDASALTDYSPQIKTGSTTFGDYQVYCHSAWGKTIPDNPGIATNSQTIITDRIYSLFQYQWNTSGNSNKGLLYCNALNTGDLIFGKEVTIIPDASTQNLLCAIIKDENETPVIFSAQYSDSKNIYSNTKLQKYTLNAITDPQNYTLDAPIEIPYPGDSLNNTVTGSKFIPFYNSYHIPLIKGTIGSGVWNVYQMASIITYNQYTPAQGDIYIWLIKYNFNDCECMGYEILSKYDHYWNYTNYIIPIQSYLTEVNGSFTAFVSPNYGVTEFINNLNVSSYDKPSVCAGIIKFPANGGTVKFFPYEDSSIGGGSIFEYMGMPLIVYPDDYSTYVKAVTAAFNNTSFTPDTQNTIQARFYYNTTDTEYSRVFTMFRPEDVSDSKGNPLVQMGYTLPDGSFGVMQYSTNQILTGTDPIEKNAAFVQNGNTIHIIGEFATGTLYRLDGTTIGKSDHELYLPRNGVYILVIETPSNISTYKIFSK